MPAAALPTFPSLQTSIALGTPFGKRGVCAFDCPEPLVTEDQYDSLEIAMTVMGWLSFVLMVFLISCYVLRKDRRFVPEVFFLLAGLSFAFCLGSMIGHENVWCSDSKRTAPWETRPAPSRNLLRFLHSAGTLLVVPSLP